MKTPSRWDRGERLFAILYPWHQLRVFPQALQDERGG